MEFDINKQESLVLGILNQYEIKRWMQPEPVWQNNQARVIEK